MSKLVQWFRGVFKQPPARLVDLHQQAWANFGYTPQDNEWANGRVYLIHDITKRFKGDCDDWAASMVNALGYEAEYIEFYLPNGVYHAACLYRGWVSDNQRLYPYQESELKHKIALRVRYDVLLRLGKKQGE